MQNLTFQIGRARVTRVVELERITNPLFLYRDMVPEAFEPHLAWLQPWSVDEAGRIVMAIQSFLVESEGRRILVDTCVGNDKERDVPYWNRLSEPFLERLADAGCAPDSVDAVLCTHLHVDHVGWNTRLEGDRWVPTFPRARYLWSRREHEHWLDSDQGHIADSVKPILDADLVDTVDDDHRLTSEVFLEPTPGHTPGHVSVRIESEGESAVITGDLMHHPVQCAEPDWPCRFDADPELARRTRRAFLERHADRPVLVLGTHFATPCAGRIVRDGAVWRFAI